MPNFPCHNFSPWPLTVQCGLKTAAGNNHVLGLMTLFPTYIKNFLFFHASFVFYNTDQLVLYCNQRGSDTSASNCGMLVMSCTHSPRTWRYLMLYAGGCADCRTTVMHCQMESYAYQVGHNNGIHDDRIGWGSQGKLEAPRWLPSGDIIAVSFQKQILQLIFRSNNIIHL